MNILASGVSSIAYSRYDYLLVGLTKLFAIIALLQLVKKLPDLINTIFGTHIKFQGGIKGRLGEMAGIGGIAQKAWTSLGNGAKNLAKLGLQAPIAGAAYAADNFYKKNHNGKSLKELKGVRTLKGIGAAIGSGVKTGSVLKAADAYNSAYDKTPVSALEKVQRMNAVNKNVDNILTNSATGNSVTTDTFIDKKKNAIAALDNNINALGGSEVLAANTRYQKKNLAASMVKSIKSDNDAITNFMNNTAGKFAVGSAEQKAITDNLAEYVATGKTANLKNFITSHRDLFDDETYKALVGDAGKIAAKERKIKYVKDNCNLTSKEEDNLNRGESAVSFLASTLESSANSAKSDLDVALAGARLTEGDKMAVDKYISAETDVNNSMAFAVGRPDDENDSERYARAEARKAAQSASSTTSTTTTSTPSDGGTSESVSTIGSSSNQSQSSSNYSNSSSTSIPGFEIVDTVEGRRTNRSNTTEDSSAVARRQRDAELETLNQRESRRPLTRQEKMRQEQIRAANEMEDFGRTSDE